MKKLIFSFLVSIITPPLLAFECKPTENFDGAQRWECQIGKKSFSVLKLKGTYQQTVKQHAVLLADEIIQGPMAEIILKLRKDLNSGSLAERELKKLILDCYYKRIRSSVSKEFFDSVKTFARSLDTKLGPKNPFTREELEKSAYAIELSIAAEGLHRKLEESPLTSIAELTSTCGIRVSEHMASSILDSLEAISKTKLGCIGFVSPASSSQDSVLMHARNLDANLVQSWNREPVLFLIEETGYLKYIATASAGVIYPGGISGMNEAGISVSLHELSTTKYKTKHSSRRAELTPYLSQRILREARTLDEAISLAKRTKSFGAWTILVSDSKTNEIASIEISGQKTKVARRRSNRPMGQSNHFLSPEMRKQNFAYSFGKVLESNSRIQVIETALHQDSENIDLGWMIDHLAGHQDYFEGFRAFGRTAVKAYNVMSTVAIPSRNEMWMSIGDRMPAAHSHFAGFEIDFKNLEFHPIEALRTAAFEDVSSWEVSLHTYVRARVAYINDQVDTAYKLMQLAYKQAQKDGVEETTYLYILGRLALELEKPFIALTHFTQLRQNPAQLAPHKQALTALYSAAAISQMPSRARKSREHQFNTYLYSSRIVLENLNQKHKHFDLKSKLSLLKKLKNTQSRVSLPKIDFVTVE